MKISCLNDMTGGWFVGDFSPSCLETKQVEVACKHYKKGDKEQSHTHKIATEITLIVNGVVKMNDAICNAGDIVTLDPGDVSDFQVLEDTYTVVVKIPSVAGDKHVV